MIRNLVHTLSSRLVVSVFNLLLLFITTKWMGAENKGEISLLVLNLSMASIIGGLFGGPSLVYLIPRFPYRNLWLINYGWVAISALIITSLVWNGLLPSTSGGTELFSLALLEGLFATNSMLLLGKQLVAKHNWLQIIKVGVIVAWLAMYKMMGTSLDYDAFVIAYRWGLLMVLIFSVWWMRDMYNRSDKSGKSYIETIRAALTFGGLVQVGNIAQLFNYRLSFYMLELLIYPIDKALIRIGIYSASLQVAEAIWQFARSVSTVQYAKVSNLESKEEGLRISLLLMKLNFIVTAAGVLLLLLLPEQLYASVFGQEFSEIKQHVIWLGPGIISLSLSNALSHFYAGVGLHKINTYSSLLGLILTIGVGYPSIMAFGTVGAALTATVVYCCQTGYQFWKLKHLFGTTWQSILISQADLKLIKSTFDKRK